MVSRTPRHKVYYAKPTSEPVPATMMMPEEDPWYLRPAVWLGENLMEPSSIGYYFRGLAQGLWEEDVAVHLHRQGSEKTDYLREVSLFPQHEPFGKYFWLNYKPWDESTRAHGVAVPMMLDFVDTYRVNNLIPVNTYNRHAATITLSEHSKDYFMSRGVQRVFVVHPGIDIGLYNPGLSYINLWEVYDVAHSSFRRWGPAPSEKDQTLILLSGFLQEKKGVEDAIVAYTQFCRTYPDHGTRLLIKNVGSHWAKPMAEIISLHTDGNAPIWYTEKELSDVEFAELINTVDVVWNPSHLEGFGLIPLQGMACGKVALVTDAHGHREYAHAGNSVGIPCREVHCPDRPAFPWYTFTTEAAVYSLRRATDASRSGSLHSASVQTAMKFSWSSAAEQFKAVMRTLEGREPRPTWREAVPGKTTFAVAIRGRQDLINRLESSIQEHEPNQELVIADDASPELIKSASGRVLRVPYHEGCATARNRSLLASRGEYVMICDADLEFKEPVLEKLIARLQREDGDLILAPKLLYPDGRIQSAGGVIEEITREPHIRTYHRFEGQPGDLPEANTEAYVDYAPTACLFFRRDLAEKLGLFWEEYGQTIWWEDVHFCLSLRELGARVLYFPEVEIIHHAGSYTAGETRPAEAFVRNARILKRCFPNLP